MKDAELKRQNRNLRREVRDLREEVATLQQKCDAYAEANAKLKAAAKAKKS